MDYENMRTPQSHGLYGGWGSSPTRAGTGPDRSEV